MNASSSLAMTNMFIFGASITSTPPFNLRATRMLYTRSRVPPTELILPLLLSTIPCNYGMHQMAVTFAPSKAIPMKYILSHFPQTIRSWRRHREIARSASGMWRISTHQVNREVPLPLLYPRIGGLSQPSVEAEISISLTANPPNRQPSCVDTLILSLRHASHLMTPILSPPHRT